MYTHTCICAYIFTHTMEYYSVIKRMTFCPFAATWMDLEGIMLSEISQRKSNTISYYLYVESKKYNKLVNKTKKKHTHRERENKPVFTSGQREGAIQDLGIIRYKLLGIK